MRVTCPFCRSNGTQLISLFGSQLLFSQYRCATCGSYFEGLREESLSLSLEEKSPALEALPPETSAPQHKREGQILDAD